ncbi:hypothetical protein CPB84DRAFT_1752412 [Gymnopilus junonius]|uniref:Uncharacterized protein n=1 Tax=Gymnopilus junonius TaxID=109634 RepID=A0A9P5ND24_GYMJU|nr:hypothetical protein CPB84DRAFT_1752412 [Gymnopilus junonius]
MSGTLIREELYMHNNDKSLRYTGREGENILKMRNKRHEAGNRNGSDSAMERCCPRCLFLHHHHHHHWPVVKEFTPTHVVRSPVVCVCGGWSVGVPSESLDPKAYLAVCQDSWRQPRSYLMLPNPFRWLDWPLLIATPSNIPTLIFTMGNSDFICSYFKQFKKKNGPDVKAAFTSVKKNSNQVPGHQLWHNYITQSWKTWGMHARITAILTAENCHPLTVALNLRHGSVEKLSQSIDCIYPALDPIARVVFRVDSLDMSLIYWTWLNLKSQVIQSRVHLTILQKEATEAFEALSKEQPMKAKVKAVIIKTSHWKALVFMLHANEYLSAVEELDAQLQALMLQLSLDLNVSECLPKPAASQLTAMTVQSLVSEKDISDVISLYIEFFNTPAPVNLVPLQEQHPTIGISLDEVERGDLGVDVEVKMSPEALSTSLGFNHADTSRPNGVLIADEVGLGKNSHGMTGSAHDAAAFEHTAASKHPEWFFEGEEFAWGDSAYSWITIAIVIHNIVIDVEGYQAGKHFMGEYTDIEEAEDRGDHYSNYDNNNCNSKREHLVAEIVAAHAG